MDGGLRGDNNGRRMEMTPGFSEIVEKQIRSTEGCSKLKRSVDMTKILFLTSAM